MGIQDFGRYIIKFYFDGKAISLKVTKFSTCDDVIHMVLHKVGHPVTKVMMYGVFERTGSAERMLGGKTLVYKVWRSWGCENKHFQFHIKSKEAKLGIKSKLSNNAESNIDDLFLDQYNRKAMESKSQASKRISGKSVSFSLENESVNDTSVVRQKQSLSSGKQIVLARYLYDLFSRSNKTKSKQSGRKRRERADGSENGDFRCADGSESTVNTTSSQHDKCRVVWDKYYATDSESESDDSFSDASSEDSVDLYNGETVSLDTAFIKSSRDSDSDEGIDVTSVTSADLDVAFIGDVETNYDTHRADKALSADFVNEQSYTEANQLERNISNDKLLKELFGRVGNTGVVSEDDEMDSFMRSRLDSF